MPRTFQAIRRVATALLWTALSVLGLVAAYAGVTAWRRPPVQFATEPPWPRPDDVVRPAFGPPPPARTVVDASAPRRASAWPRPTGAATVRLRGQPGDGDLVVAVVDGSSGAELDRYPLPSPPPGRIEFAELPVGEHRVVLGRAGDSLRFSYLSRAVLRVGVPGDGPDASTELDLSLHDVVVTVVEPRPDRADRDRPRPLRAVTPILRRTDDPLWRPARGIRAGIDPTAVARPGEPGRLALPGLGNGDYELRLEGLEQPGVRRFQLPGGTSITVEGRYR